MVTLVRRLDIRTLWCRIRYVTSWLLRFALLLLIRRKKSLDLEGRVPLMSR